MDKIIKDIIKDGLSDSELKGFGWSENGENLWIKLSLADNKTVTLIFIWATSLSVKIDFGEYFGMPLIFESKFTVIDGSFWNVEIIFGAAPEGMITFKCNDISLAR